MLTMYFIAISEPETLVIADTARGLWDIRLGACVWLLHTTKISKISLVKILVLVSYTLLAKQKNIYQDMLFDRPNTELALKLINMNIICTQVAHTSAF